MASKWNVDDKTEKRKLAPSESDWNLAGHGETLVGKRQRKARTFLGDSSSDESYSSGSDESSSEETEEEALDLDNSWNDRKPPASRMMLESSALTELIETNMRCPKCGGDIEFLLETITIATKPWIQCKSKQCGFIAHGQSPTPASLPQFKDNRMRNTDFALNVLYVLATIVNGDGGTEAGRMLGLLGLPNDTTMTTRSFGTIEERIAPVVASVYNEILEENLMDEVRLSFGVNQNGFQLWKSALPKMGNNVVLQQNNYAKVCASFDMGWQKRGKQHNSPSGHAFFVGKHTRKPICGDIKSKLCAYCKSWHQKRGEGIAPPNHYCVKNYSGSSGGMEPIACADMLTLLHDRYNVDVELVCMDDDSSTRQAIRWNNADYLKNNNTNTLPQVPI